MPYDRLMKNQSKLIIGMKQTLRGLNNGEVSEVYIAEDADQSVTQPVIDLAAKLNIPCHLVPSMKKLGSACGIEVGTSTAAIKRS